MLPVYIASLIAGGGLLLLSFFMGDGHGDADGSLDHAGADAQDTGEHAADGHGWWSALPFTSLSFWTFFLAFFGLTGVVLTAFGLLGSALLIAVIAVALGFGAGFPVGHLLRRLRRDEVDSSVRPLDFVGALGTVTLPVAKDAPGKVRVQVKDRSVDLIATTDEAALPAHTEVVVHEVLDDGAVKVVRIANA